MTNKVQDIFTKHDSIDPLKMIPDLSVLLLQRPQTQPEEVIIIFNIYNIITGLMPILSCHVGHSVPLVGCPGEQYASGHLDLL